MDHSKVKRVKERLSEVSGRNRSIYLHCSGLNQICSGMFLSKKWIVSIIAVTGISFMILLVIQFGWIRKSIDISRRHFADHMIVVTNNIRDAFQQDKALQYKYLTGSFGRYDLFAGDVSMQRLEGIIKQK